jgi:signal transduction histidine kinase
MTTEARRCFSTGVTSDYRGFPRWVGSPWSKTKGTRFFANGPKDPCWTARLLVYHSLMKWNRWVEQPRLLGLLALAFSLVPVWLAIITYREARQKDQQLFEATAQVLAEQLRDLTGRPIYYVRVMRGHAQSLPNAELFAGKMQTPGFSWQERLPQLIAFGYAERAHGKVLLRWKSEERAPVAKLGNDLTTTPGLLLAPDSAPRTQRSTEAGCLLDQSRMLVLLPVLEEGEPGLARGDVAAWIDLNALCHDDSMPGIRDHFLTARPRGTVAPAPGDAVKIVAITVPYSTVAWDVVIERGPKFGDHFGGPAPLLAVLAVALSTVPLLILTILAGRAAKLRATLTIERQISEQQQFFTQSVSHEFRTPLSIILSGADLLEHYATELTPERRAEVLAEIKDNTRQMNAMVENVLALGRIDAHKIEVNPQPAKVAAFCENLVGKVRTATHDRCPITVSAVDRVVAFDTALVSSVLDNLLSNAVKYSAPGTPVSLTAEWTHDQLDFIVRDQGIGIPKQDLPHLGELFYRSGNVGDISGAGLGLAIARRYISLMRGTMTFDSHEGQGTTAIVTLPCAEETPSIPASS